jgi:hypothetical protein
MKKIIGIFALVSFLMASCATSTEKTEGTEVDSTEIVDVQVDSVAVADSTMIIAE